MADMLKILRGRDEPAIGNQAQDNIGKKLEASETSAEGQVGIQPDSGRPAAERAEHQSVRQEATAMADTVRSQESTATAPSRVTRWGIPIGEGWDPSDRVFARHPSECRCFRQGELRCAVPCVWAWPPGAPLGDKVLEVAIGKR